MNMLSHPRSHTRRFLRALLMILLGGIVPAHALFPEPVSSVLAVGQKVVIKVKGSPSSTKISLDTVSFSPEGGLSSDFVPSETGNNVEVEITALAPGEYTVFFSGVNKFETPQAHPASGPITIKVLSKVGTSAQGTQTATAGDPVNTSNGEYYADEGADFNLGGPMPLTFSRYVASGLSTDNLVQASLGTNRSHNFASRIITPFPSVTTVKRVVLPAGRTLQFDKVGTKWVLKSPLDVPFQLIEASGNFLLGHPETRQIWTYDNTGKLTKIEDGRGGVHTLTYTGANLTGVSDGLGRSLTLTYTSGRITKVADHAGREVNYTYTSGVLTAVQDYGGGTTNYANDASGRPLSVTYPRGNMPLVQSYNAGGKVTSQTMAGHTSTLTYNAGNTVFTDPTGNTLTDFYDANGRLASHVDQDGKAITMTYDSAGRRTSVTNREGNKTSFTYHALSGQMASAVNPEGRSTLFAYTARTLSGLVFYDLTKITYPDGAARAFKFDAKGNLTQITDENGKVWKYTFNVNGQVVTATNPLGAVTTYQYDAMGDRISAQPPDEGATQFGYDLPRKRLNLITRPGGATVTFAYDARDRVTTITDERGKARSYAYDANSNVTKITDPDAEETNITYDVMDRVLTVTDRLGQTTNYAYNSIGRLASVQDRNGNIFAATYNDRQRVESLTDPGGQVWSFTHDDEGRQIEMEAPAGPLATSSRSQRNRLGRPSAFIDTDGHTSRIIRNAMQRITATVDPMGRQTNFGYDKMGRLLSVTEQGTAAAKFDRDALGNVIKITDPNGGVWATTRLKSGYVSKNTDPLGKSTSYTYTNRGRLSGATFPDSTTTALSYDAAGNLTQQQFSNTQGPNLIYAYDNQNRITSANGISFEYDNEGRVINCPQGGMDFEATYDAGGRLTSVGYRNGAFIVTYSYDSRSRLVQVTDNVSNVDVDFSYDNQGRLTGITRTPGIDATFTYSTANRLTQIQEGAVLDLIYSHNPAGDVTTVDYTAPVLPSVAAGTQSFKYGKAGEITTTGHTYDALGRMTASPGKTFIWNGVSNLISYSGVDLAYNGLGHLVSRTAGGLTTQFQRHYAMPGAPIVFADAPGVLPDVAYVCTPGGKLLYSVDMTTQEASFYHFDRMGSTLAITNEAGTVINAYAYGPYGELLGSMAGPIQPFTFLGRHGVRTELDLYQMGARYYDPAAARFISRDPLPPRLEDPESLSRYAYASASPLRYIDPSGGRDEVSEIADVISSQAQHYGIALFVEIFDRAFVRPIEPDIFAAYASSMALPLAPPIVSGPFEVSDGPVTSGPDFFPPPPGGPVGAFPGVAINDEGGGDTISGPMDTLTGSNGNDFLSGGVDDNFGGGVNVATGDLDGDGRDDKITIANTTIAENTADGVQVADNSAAAAAAHKALLDFFTSVYLGLQDARAQLIVGVVNNGGQTDKATADKINAIDEQKKIIKKIIKAHGGTVPK